MAIQSMMLSCCRLLGLCVALFLPCYGSAPPNGASLSSESWHLCEKFINTQAPDFFLQGMLRIPPAKDHPYVIEQDPVTKAIYIHLKGENGAFVGEGLFKHVTQSILYGKEPELVACCEGGASLEKEAKILSKLRGATGIVQLKSYIRRPNSTSELILEYFNAGSLKDIETKKLSIDEKEMLPVIRDLIVGLHNLHQAGYVHRDLHRKNILFSRKKGVLCAALADFGLAFKLKKNSNAALSAQDSACAPEILLKKVCLINRKKAEAYSLGILFHFLILRKNPSWSNSFTQKELSSFSEIEKKAIYRKIVASYKEALASVQSTTGLCKDLSVLTFQLLNPDPHKRIYLDKARKRIERIVRKSFPFASL
jgi:serine/threonine protein kinase